jgi:hypothetical protein
MKLINTLPIYSVITKSVNPDGLPYNQVQIIDGCGPDGYQKELFATADGNGYSHINSIANWKLSQKFGENLCSMDILMNLLPGGWTLK